MRSARRNSSPAPSRTSTRRFCGRSIGKSFAAIIQPRLETLAQIREKVAFLNEMPEYDISLYTHKKMKTTPENSLDILRAARETLAGVADFF